MKPNRVPWQPTAACTLLLAAAPAARAADDAPGGRLEEIVVTAQKRVESLDKVPMSVTAIDEQALEDQRVKAIDDVARLVPGLNLRSNSYLGDPTISVRGISSTAGSATTGIYIDETPIQTRNNDITTSNAYPKVFDLQQVEVLRGPQGTLYGAGSEGGTVRFITPPPGLTQSDGFARAEFSATEGGDPSWEAGGAWGGPLIEGRLGIRASAWHREQGGYIDRVSPQTGEMLDRNANSGTDDVARVALRYEPTDRFAVGFSVYYQRSRQDDQGLSWEGAGRDRALYQLPSPITDRFVLPSLDLALQFDDFTARSITSYFDRKAERYADATAFDLSGLLPGGAIAIPPDPAHPEYAEYVANSFYRNSQENWTQEFRLVSNDAPEDRWSWVGGLFYQHNKQGLYDWYAEPLGTVTAYLDTLTEPNVCQDPETGLSYGPAVADCFGVDLIDGIYSGIQDQSSTETEIAAYANVAYEFTPALTGKLGLRVARSEFEYVDRQDGPYTGGPTVARGSQKETPVTPMVSLAYQATGDTLFYGTAAKGYRIGGANSSLAGNPACTVDLDELGIADVPATYDSDSVWSYEVGAKTRLGGRLALDASVYWIDWKNIQQLVYLPTCGYYYTDNVGAARSRGFDLQAAWAATDGLTLSGTVGYTDAQYTETVGPASAVLVVDGDRLPTPEWTATFAAEYRFAVGAAESYVRGDYQYAGSYERFGSSQTFSFDPATTHQPATNYVSMRAGVTFGAWDLALFVDNLLDDRTSLYRYHDTYDSPGFRNLRFRPRTTGLTLEYSF